MDVLDRASSLEAKQRQMAIANHCAKQKTQAQQTSAEECIECEAPIPQARRLAILGCQHCVECQALLEQGNL